MAHDQIDWSNAPVGAVALVMNQHNKPYWLICRVKPIGDRDYWQTEWVEAQHFEFNGDWRNSLTPRPQE
jgi:hypothetical protein